MNNGIRYFFIEIKFCSEGINSASKEEMDYPEIVVAVYTVLVEQSIYIGEF
jgi:hypothetical protein